MDLNGCEVCVVNSANYHIHCMCARLSGTITTPVQHHFVAQQMPEATEKPSMSIIGLASVSLKKKVSVKFICVASKPAVQ